MLIRYKKNLEKIAMGLLSFMPEEKNVKTLQQTMKEYESNPNWHLYLWRDGEVLGAIGIRIEDEINAVVQHISVNPSYRNLGIGMKMVNGIKDMYEAKYAVCADEFTEKFYNRCSDDMEQEKKKDE